jgi:hypothetical protein
MDFSQIPAESISELIALLKWGGTGTFVLLALWILRDAIRELFKKGPK